MNGVASSLSLWQLTCDHTVDTFPLIWIFAISTSFSTIQGSSSLCHKNGDNIQIRNRNSYSQVMPHTVASSRKQPLFSLINVSVILNTLVYSFLLAQGSVRCCLVVSPTSASSGYAAVACSCSLLTLARVNSVTLRNRSKKKGNRSDQTVKKWGNSTWAQVVRSDNWT